MAQVNKDNLTLERPRIELAFAGSLSADRPHARMGKEVCAARMAAAAQRSEPDFTSGEASPSVAQDARPRGMQIVKT